VRIVMPFGPATRNDGGAFYIHKALNRIPGVTCEYREVTTDPETWGPYDGVVYVDWAQDAFALPLPPLNTGKTTVLWLSDTHMGETARQNRFEWGHSAGGLATVCFYHPEAVEPYLKSLLTPCAPQRVLWLPAAADHTIYTPPLIRDDEDRAGWPPDPDFIGPRTCEVIPRYDVAWVGHVGDPEREECLDRMFKEFPNFTFYSGLFFEQAAREFHTSAIVFNKSVRGDLNCRTFEALSSRSFLLTDVQRGMDTLGFQDGIHGATYRTMDEAVDKARYYLAHPDERRRIAHLGWRWCLANHTYWHRARTLVSPINMVIEATLGNGVD